MYAAEPSAHGWFRRMHPMAVDGMLGLLATSIALDTVLDSAPDHLTHDIPFGADGAVGLGLMVLGAVALLWRRRSALGVLVVSGSAFTIYEVLGYALPPLPLAPLVALYTGAATWRLAVSAAAVGTLVLGAVVAAVIRDGALTDDRFLTYLLAMVAVWLLGRHLRASHVRGALAEARTARLAQEQAANTRVGIDREKTRIIRELHDIVAQNVCLIVAQAGAARRVFDTEPESARQVISTIETTGRAALGEMRRALGALQADEWAPAGGAAPADDAGPGLDQLPGLLERLGEAGLPVRLVVHGEPQPLPAQVDAAAYRIVQEALTNSLDHADGTQADVLLSYHPGTLRLRIRDDGRSATQDVTLGHGIFGMWQRAAQLGGELSVASRSATGFQVTARLPLNGHQP
jgi:signal transduction histidine kinase